MVYKTKKSILKNQILEWIISGKFKPGGQIYSEHELMKLFGFSRHTVRHALSELVYEGWLNRKKGAGTYCTKKTLGNHSSLGGKDNNSTRNIGLITRSISDFIFPSIIKGIESYLTDQNYTLTLACTNDDIRLERICIQRMISGNIDGLIIEPTIRSNKSNLQYFKELEKINIPYVMINQFPPELMPPYIVVNDEKGSYIATEHLIKLGHNRIVGIFKTCDLQGINKMRGFIHAFKQFGLKLDPELVFSYDTDLGESDVTNSLKKIFSLKDPPSAIVCYNDKLALKVLDIMRSIGKNVPDDVSVVGYDDTFLAEASDVKLTSIKHPKMQLGVDAAKWIVYEIEIKRKKHPSIIYEPEIVIRNSTSIKRY